MLVDDGKHELAAKSLLIMGGECTVHHNFIRAHEALDGETPARKVGIVLPFEDGWGDLIRWSLYFERRRGLK